VEIVLKSVTRHVDRTLHVLKPLTGDFQWRRTFGRSAADTL